MKSSYDLPEKVFEMLFVLEISLTLTVPFMIDGMMGYGASRVSFICQSMNPGGFFTT